MNSHSSKQMALLQLQLNSLQHCGQIPVSLQHRPDLQSLCTSTSLPCYGASSVPAYDPYMSHPNSECDAEAILVQLYASRASPSTSLMATQALSSDGNSTASMPQANHQSGMYNLDSFLDQALAVQDKPNNYMYMDTPTPNQGQRPTLLQASQILGGNSDGQPLQWISPRMEDGVVAGLDVMPSTRPMTGASAPVSTQASLYVKNLPPDATELMLYQKFSPFGALLSCKIPMDSQTGRCKGVGFVNFVDREDAVHAMQHLHGARLAEGRHMHVTIQVPRMIRPPSSTSTSSSGGVFVPGSHRISNKGMQPPISHNVTSAAILQSLAYASSSQHGMR